MRLDYGLDTIKSVITIPDIHGDVDALVLSLKTFGVIDDSGDLLIDKDTKLVFLGDYINRGPSSIDVINYLMSLKSKCDEVGVEISLLFGNHDIPLKNLYEEDEDRNMEAMDELEYYGDLSLLNDLCGGKNYLEGKESWEPYNREALLSKYKDFVDGFKLIEVVGPVLFVHGGIETKLLGLMNDFPNLKDLNSKDFSYEINAGIESLVGPLWIRFNECIGFLKDDSSANKVKEIGVEYVVVGHTPFDEVKIESVNGVSLIGLDVGMSSGMEGCKSKFGGCKIDFIWNSDSNYVLKWTYFDASGSIVVKEI